MLGSRECNSSLHWLVIILFLCDQSIAPLFTETTTMNHAIILSPCNSSSVDTVSVLSSVAQEILTRSLPLISARPDTTSLYMRTSSSAISRNPYLSTLSVFSYSHLYHSPPINRLSTPTTDKTNSSHTTLQNPDLPFLFSLSTPLPLHLQ